VPQLGLAAWFVDTPSPWWGLEGCEAGRSMVGLVAWAGDHLRPSRLTKRVASTLVAIVVSAWIAEGSAVGGAGGWEILGNFLRTCQFLLFRDHASFDSLAIHPAHAFGDPRFCWAAASFLTAMWWKAWW